MSHPGEAGIGTAREPALALNLVSAAQAPARDGRASHEPYKVPAESWGLITSHYGRALGSLGTW